MGSLQIALFIALACAVSAIPQVLRLDQESGWKQTATISSQTTIKDGTLKEVAFVNITVGLFNYTTESHQFVSETVNRSLSNIPLDSEPLHDPLRMYEGVQSKLPLTFNMTLVKAESTGPSVPKAVAVMIHVDVYAQKKHRSDVLASLKNFSL